MFRNKGDIALKTAIIYGVAGSLWIILSDLFLDRIVPDQQTLTELQTYKGWFFVLVTTGILFLGLRKSILSLKRESDRRKRAEEELRELNLKLEERIRQRTIQLEESNQEMEAFISSVSHELRAPLRTIKSYIDILSEEMEPGPTAEESRLMAIIKDGATQMQRLIEDLHKLSYVSRSNMQPDIVRMKEMVIALTHEQSEFNGRIETVFEIGEMPDIRGDSNLIKQVWINLLSNAIKFTATTSNPLIRIEGITKNGHAEYCVRDNGVGFRPEYVKNLFRVFNRLHSRAEFEGTGVGLSVVRRIVQRHGGMVWAEGDEGKGAAFYFSLPLNNGI